MQVKSFDLCYLYACLQLLGKLLILRAVAPLGNWGWEKEECPAFFGSWSPFSPQGRFAPRDVWTLSCLLAMPWFLCRLSLAPKEFKPNIWNSPGLGPAHLPPFCESTKSGADLEQGAVGGAHGRIREGSRLPLQGADIVNFEEGEGLLAMQQWRWLDVDESLGEIGIRVEMLNLGGGGC